MGKRGVTGAKIIERNTHSFGPQIFRCSGDVIVVTAHKNRFVDFQDDMLERDVGGCELLYDPVFETAFLEVWARNINADMLE
jgi:hypothetical protein